MPIQFILIIVIVLIILRLIFKLRTRDINPPIFYGWLLVWLVALIIIWQPSLTSYLANRLGVSRGVDLVIYVSVILIFYLLFRLLMRIEKLDKDITRLVRQLALRDETNNKKEKDG